MVSACRRLACALFSPKFQVPNDQNNSTRSLVDWLPVKWLMGLRCLSYTDWRASRATRPQSFLLFLAVQSKITDQKSAFFLFDCQIALQFSTMPAHNAPLYPYWGCTCFARANGTERGLANLQTMAGPVIDFLNFCTASCAKTYKSARAKTVWKILTAEHAEAVANNKSMIHELFLLSLSKGECHENGFEKNVQDGCHGPCEILVSLPNHVAM